MELGWGVIVNFKSVMKSKQEGGGISEAIINVLLNLERSVENSEEDPVPCTSGKLGEPEIINIRHDMVEDLSSLRLNKMPNDLKSRDSRMLLYNNVKVSYKLLKYNCNNA